MPLKDLPDFRVLAYPSDGLPRCLVTPFSHTDLMHSLLLPQTGEGALAKKMARPLSEADILEQVRVGAWREQDEFAFLGDGVRFVRLGAMDEGDKDGTKAATGATAQVQQREDGFGEISGFALVPSYVPLHFRLNDFDESRDPKGETRLQVELYHVFRPIIWKPVRGLPRGSRDAAGNPILRKVVDLRGKNASVKTHWDSVCTDDEPRLGRIFHGAHTPDDYVAVETQEKWPANRGFYLDIEDLQIAAGNTGQTRLRIEFGDQYALILRDGETPAFEKRIYKRTTGAVPSGDAKLRELPDEVKDALKDELGAALTGGAFVAATPQWNTVSQLGRSGKVAFGKARRIFLSVERLAGRFRFTVGLGDAPPGVYDVIDRVAIDDMIGEPTRFEPRPAAWKAAKIRVFFAGLSGHMGGGEVLFVNPAVLTGTSIEGVHPDELRMRRARMGKIKRASLARLISCPGRLVEGELPRARAIVAGWNGDGTHMETTACNAFLRHVGRGLRTRALAYSVELRASRDGQDTPLLSMVGVEIDGEYWLPQRAPLDITAACTGTAKLSTGEPPDVPGAELSLSIDRTILERLAVPDGVPGDGSWNRYVAPRKRITFEARWNYTDGSQDEWQTLFDGWIYSPANQNERFLEHRMTLLCRDGLMRLSKPFAFIDSRYRAGSYVWVNDRKEKPLYGAMMVYEILRASLGEVVALRLNGGVSGIDDVAGMLRFFPRNHFPLLGNENNVAGFLPLASNRVSGGANMPTQGQPQLPPPFRQCARDWIERIAKLDRAIFFWGYSPNLPGVPVPIYGRVTEFYKAARALGDFVVADCVYSDTARDAQVNAIIGGIESRYLPERDINQVVVFTGSPPEGHGVIPSVAMGLDRFSPGPLTDPDDGGDATLLLEDDAFLKLASGMNRDAIQSLLNGIAAIELAQFAGVKQESVSIRLPRGTNHVFWGRTIMPRMRAGIGGESGETQGAGDVSDRGIELDGKRFCVTRVEHGFDFMNGGTAWTTNVVARPFSGMGL